DRWVGDREVFSVRGRTEDRRGAPIRAIVEERLERAPGLGVWREGLEHDSLAVPGYGREGREAVYGCAVVGDAHEGGFETIPITNVDTEELPADARNQVGR